MSEEYQYPDDGREPRTQKMRGSGKSKKRGSWLAEFIFIVVLVVIDILTSGCSPETDPRNIADGIAIEAEASRLDAVNTYNLEQKLLVDTIENTEKQTKLDIFTSVKNTLIVTSKWAISLLAVVIIPASGHYFWELKKSAILATRRISIAMAEAAELQAKFIRVPQGTRLLPAIAERLPDGHLMLTNLNTENVTDSSLVQAASPQAAAIAGAIAAVGVAGRETRKTLGANSADVASVSRNMPTFGDMPDGATEIINARYAVVEMEAN